MCKSTLLSVWIFFCCVGCWGFFWSCFWGFCYNSLEEDAQYYFSQICQKWDCVITPGLSYSLSLSFFFFFCFLLMKRNFVAVSKFCFVSGIVIRFGSFWLSECPDLLPSHPVGGIRCSVSVSSSQSVQPLQPL